MVYCFEAIITWSTAKVGDEVKVEVKSNLKLIAQNPYSFAKIPKDKYFRGWKMVGHIPHEILQHVYFFIKQEGGRVSGKPKQNPL